LTTSILKGGVLIIKKQLTLRVFLFVQILYKSKLLTESEQTKIASQIVFL